MKLCVCIVQVCRQVCCLVAMLHLRAWRSHHLMLELFRYRTLLRPLDENPVRGPNQDTMELIYMHC